MLTHELKRSRNDFELSTKFCENVLSPALTYNCPTVLIILHPYGNPIRHADQFQSSQRSGVLISAGNECDLWGKRGGENEHSRSDRLGVI